MTTTDYSLLAASAAIIVTVAACWWRRASETARIYVTELELVLRAVSTSLRQLGSAFTVATPRHRRGATTTDRAADAAGQRPHAGSRPGCRSSVLGHLGGSFSTAD